jgi:hypothetical protein
LQEKKRRNSTTNEANEALTSATTLTITTLTDEQISKQNYLQNKENCKDIDQTTTTTTTGI